MTIPYRISRIETKQIAVFPDVFVWGDAVNVPIEFKFTADTHKNEVCTVGIFRYEQKQKLLLILELACYFNISQEGWSEVKKEDKWIIPVDFLRYMATIVVGAARGILHVKTEGTAFNSIILPPINLVEIIKEDYVIGEKK